MSVYSYADKSFLVLGATLCPAAPVAFFITWCGFVSFLSGCIMRCAYITNLSLNQAQFLLVLNPQLTAVVGLSPRNKLLSCTVCQHVHIAFWKFSDRSLHYANSCVSKVSLSCGHIFQILNSHEEEVEPYCLCLMFCHILLALGNGILFISPNVIDGVC